MYAANGTGQHTLRLFSTPEMAAAGRGMPPWVWAQAEQRAEKRTRHCPGHEDENDSEQKDEQNNFEEHARSKKQSLRMTPAV
jgi:hypothetical protein